MNDKRNITRDDMHLKARLLAEGVRVTQRQPLVPGHRQRMLVLAGCEMTSILWINPYSRLEAIVDGAEVTIRDGDETIGTGCLEPEPGWYDLTTSSGEGVRSAISASSTIINIMLNWRCYNYDAGKGCRYCGIYSFTRHSPALRPAEAEAATQRQVEAAIVGIQNGWRGTIVLTGGVLPPSKRERLIDRIETVMTRFREVIDDETLAELHLAPNVYPPSDFDEMWQWRDLGVNSTEIDLEVMDPAYFKAICPGKSEAYSQEHWKAAQEASAEVFGRGRGATTAVVTGIEPMSALVEGIEERISKGVYTTPLSFLPALGSPYENFRPPSAPWIMEMSEKIADVYFRYADTLDQDLLTDNRFGFTRIGRSFYMMLAVDEMTRRLQESGRFPAGLPKQDGLPEPSH